MTSASSKNAKADTPLPVTNDEEDEVDFAIMRKFEPVPADEPFVAIITKWSRDKSLAGHGLINVQVETQKSRDGAEAHLGKYISGRYSLQPQSLFSLFGLLVALGHDAEELKTKTPPLGAEHFLGMPVIVFARDNVYNDVTTSQIRRTISASKWDEVLQSLDTEAEREEGQEVPNI